MVLPATTALQQLLAAWGPVYGLGQPRIQMADLFTFQLQGGETFRYSGFQTGLQAPAPNTAAPLFVFRLGPKFKTSTLKRKLGTEISELEIELYAGAGDLLALASDLTWQEALWAGLFDGATCRVWRAFITDQTNVAGTITRFYGRVGDVVIGRTKTVIHVRSLLDLLGTQMPKRLVQPACDFDFGLKRCGYNRVLGKNALGQPTGIGEVLTTALAGSSQNSIVCGFAPNPATIYNQGTIIGASGLNTGYSRNIAELQEGTVYFLDPWVFPVAAGDKFKLQPGCDHTLATCTGPFQNQLRYGGDPYIPPPEAAV